MSLIPQRSGQSPEEQAKAARHLVRSCGMSEADVDRILDLQRTEELSFTEAAMRLGLAAQSDVDAALARPETAAPVADGRASEEVQAVHDPFHPFTEQLRTLRQELLLRNPEDSGLCVAVVSPGAQEGRSRIAAELAVVLAQLDESTLLIDADLRKPRQHVLFDVEGEIGLGQAVRQGASPRVHGIDGLPALSVLAAGEAPGNPMELLTGRPFGELLAGLRRRYQHVILDTPPAAQFSDALAVANHAGAALVVIGKDRSELAACKNLQRRLATTRANILGAVMNAH